MANRSHLAIVKKGAEAIAAWRNRHPKINLDLRGAPLRRADFVHANLIGADLRDANLEWADFRWADLVGADLSRSNLVRADFHKADLAGAKLRRADLRMTNFEDASLRDVDCGDAIFAYTRLLNTDLAGTENLSRSRHLGPSTIDRETLAKSVDLPAEFLRGCGLSDLEIEGGRLYDRELSRSQIVGIQARLDALRSKSPVQISPLFISYSHADSAFVDALEVKLNERVIRFWRDVHDAPAGPLDAIVDRAMAQNPTVLLILSRHSVESDWVEDEANRARTLEKQLGRHVLCPISLDDAWKTCRWSRKLRTQLEKYNILAFAGWESSGAFENMFRRLVAGLSLFYQPAKA